MAVTAIANRIYSEAFRRLGLSYETRSLPGLRQIMLTKQGKIDGLVHRARDLQQRHPDLLFVDAMVGKVQIVALTADPALSLGAWRDLRATTHEVDWWKDVRLLGLRLTPEVPAERLENVASNASGLAKLLAGRTDLFITVWEVAKISLGQPEFANKGIRVAGILEEIELFPYLSPGHEALVPKLANTIRQIRREGLIDRYKEELEAAQSWQP